MGFGFLMPSLMIVQIVLALSCTLAFALNYTIFMNTAVNSALTQTVCGNLKVWCVGHKGFEFLYFARLDKCHNENVRCMETMHWDL